MNNKHYILLHVHENISNLKYFHEKEQKIKSLDGILTNALSETEQDQSNKVRLDKFVFLFQRDDNLSNFADIVYTLNKEKISYSILYFETDTDNEWQHFNKNYTQNIPLAKGVL
jgi:hypothetical protein